MDGWVERDESVKGLCEEEAVVVEGGVGRGNLTAKARASFCPAPARSQEGA